MPDTIISFAFAHFLLFYGLTCTPPSSSVRLLLVFLIACCCLVSVRSTIAGWVPGGVGYEYIIGFILHSSSFLSIAKLSPPQGAAKSERTRWGLHQIISARWGTTFHPPFDKCQPSYAPVRYELFKNRLKSMLWTGGVAWFLTGFPLNTNRLDFISVPNGFLDRIGYMSQDEVIIRVYLSTSGYLLQYCTLSFFHSFASCIAMLAGADPKQWPPLFGSLKDAYTVRRWFAMFWHLLMRKAFTSHAVVLSTNVLRLPKDSRFTRVAIVCFTFVISAVMHMFAMPGLEQCSAWPQVRYWCSIFLAIVVEDTVIATSKQIAKLGSKVARNKSLTRFFPAYPAGVTNENGPALVFRVIGYTWVLCFHVWAGSMVIYGLWSRCATD